MLDSVKAKMSCWSNKADYEGSENTQLHLEAVVGYDEDGELTQNLDFSNSTPSGQCMMLIEKNRPAASFFKEGRDYYITFVEVPKEEASNPSAYE